MKAKVNVLAKPHPYIFFTLTDTKTASLRAAAESAPIHVVIIAMHKFYTLINMTSLEFTQAQGLGYTKGMYRVPLSIPTYDSVMKVQGMVLASSPDHFPPPTWPRSVFLVCSYTFVHHLANCSVKKM